MEEKKPMTDKSIQDLHRFLEEKAESEIEPVRAEPMTDDEMELFFKNIAMPAFKTLKTEMLAFSFERLDSSFHTKVGVFKVIETFSQFIFRIEINNQVREIKVSPTLKYRTLRRGKLVDAQIREAVIFPFEEQEKLNQKKIISLFINWFTSKDEYINLHSSKAQGNL